MKIYEAWEELQEWLQKQAANVSPAVVLDKMDELEIKHE